MRRDPLGFLTRIAREYGDVSRFRAGPVWIHLLNRPEWIRDLLVTHAASFHKGRGLERAKRLLGEGLLTSEDPVHLRQRRMMQPAFHAPAHRGLRRRSMVELAERRTDRWQAGETRDVAAEMTRLTLAIVGRTLFDADVESEADEIGAALTTALELFDAGPITLPYFEMLDRLPLPSNRRFRAGEGAHRRDDRPADRRAPARARPARGDLLEPARPRSDAEGDGRHDRHAGARRGDDDLPRRPRDDGERARVDVVPARRRIPRPRRSCTRSWTRRSAAGAPTVARSAAAAVHRDGPRRVHASLSAGLDHRPPRHRAVSRRRLRRAARTRSSSPASGSRTATRASSRSRSASIPSGGRPEAKESRPKFSYFPFGGGPRVCIGEGFAWMEGILVARDDRAALASPAGAGPGSRPGAGRSRCGPKNGIRMILERRG